MQTNGGRFVSGVAELLGLGLGVSDALGVGLDPPPGPTELTGRFRGLATNSTPITTVAITAAATPAIQNGPLCSGTLASDDRTRSGSAAEGDPAMSSKTWPSSWRKFSLLTLENLLEGEIGAQPFGRAVDAEIGGRRRDPQRSRDLVKRQAEGEMQHQRQPLFRAELDPRLVQIGSCSGFRCQVRRRNVSDFQNRPPALAPRHPALVGDDRKKPRSQRSQVAAQLAQLAPRLDGGFLNRVLS